MMFASQHDLLLAIILLVFASGIAMVLGYFLSNTVTERIHVLKGAAEILAGGDLQTRVPIQGRDEVAALAASFNQMAAQLEEVETMRRQLIGDVTHELRTPLTSIKGYMEGLIDGVLPSTPETFNQIHHEAERLSRLVDDLQELSRVEAGAY